MSSGPPPIPPKKPTSKGSPPPRDDDDDDGEGSYSFANEHSPEKPKKNPQKKGKQSDLFEDGLDDDDFDDGLDDRPIGGSRADSQASPAIHAGDVLTKKPSPMPVIIGGVVVAGLLFVGCIFLLVVMWPRPDPMPVQGGGSNIPANPLGSSGPVGSGGPKFSFTK